MPEIKTSQAELENEYETSVARPWGFLAGLLFGALAGATVLYMLAPQSGKRTRAKIHQKGIELRDQATEAVEDVMSQAQAKTHHVTIGVRKDTRKLQRHAPHEWRNEQDEHAERLPTAQAFLDPESGSPR